MGEIIWGNQVWLFPSLLKVYMHYVASATLLKRQRKKIDYRFDFFDLQNTDLIGEDNF